MHPNGVFANDLGRGMHQSISERAIRCEYQQTRCRKIQSADSDPSSALEWRQVVKYLLAALRIVACRDFVTRLVINDVAVRLRDAADRQWPAVESDLLGSINLIADLGQSAIDRQAPFAYPGFDFAARAVTCARQCLLYPVRQGLATPTRADAPRAQCPQFPVRRWSKELAAAVAQLALPLDRDLRRTTRADPERQPLLRGIRHS